MSTGSNGAGCAICGAGDLQHHAPDCPAPPGGSAQARAADPLSAWREAAEEARRLDHAAAVKREALIVAVVADREAQAALHRARDRVDELEHLARSAQSLAGKLPTGGLDMELVSLNGNAKTIATPRTQDDYYSSMSVARVGGPLGGVKITGKQLDAMAKGKQPRRGWAKWLG